MMNPLCALLLLASAAAPPVPRLVTETAAITPAKLAPAEIFRRASPYIVTIQTEDTTGTGFVAPNGHIYTALHVVDGKKSIKAVFPDKRTVELQWVVASHPNQDWVAFHSTETSKLIINATPNQEIGSKVVVIGSPRGLDQTITEGLMSAKRTVGAMSLLQVSAAVSPGSSGSPLFNEQGEVIGLISSKLGEAEQLTFAVPSFAFHQRIGINIGQLGKAPGVGTGATDKPSDFNVNYLRWVSNNGKSLPLGVSELRYLNTVKLEVFLNSDAKRHISESELKAWVRAQLGIHCPRLVIVDDEEARNMAFKVKLSPNDDPLTTVISDHASWDALTRTLSVSIEALSRDPISCYTIETSVRRGVIGLSGRSFADVFKSGSFGTFGSLVDIRTTWQRTAADQIQKFCELWEKANPVP